MTSTDTAAQGGLLSLAGKTALISGGASGMGRAASLLFAAHGAHVIITDRNPQTCASTLAEVQAAGGSAETHVLDVVDGQAIKDFTSSLAVDAIDVFYNHAGVTGATGWSYDRENLTETLAINLMAPMELTAQLLAKFRAAKNGASLIYTVSTAGLRAVPGLLPYAASKGGLIQFIKSIAVSLAPERIRANGICRGATDTPSLRRDLNNGVVQITAETIANGIPMRRLGTPEDMANLALFLASDASSYITGQAIAVDGAATA
jgi:3-oxoacyl-[acyl-carrier protein] reductase